MTAPKSGETNEGESPPAGKPQPQLLQLLANGTAGITPSHSRGSPGSTLLTQNPQPVISQVVQTPRETASLPSQDGAVSSRESLAALDPAIMALPKHAPLQASTDGMSTPRDGQTSLQSSLGSQKTPNVLQQLVATFPRTDPVQHTMPSHTIPTAQTTAHLRSPLDFQALNQRQTDAQATSQRGLSEQRDDQQTTGTRTSPSGLPVGQPSDQQMGGARSLRREVPALTREQMQQALLHLIQVGVATHTSRAIPSPSPVCFSFYRTIRTSLMCCMMRISRVSAALPHNRGLSPPRPSPTVCIARLALYACVSHSPF